MKNKKKDLKKGVSKQLVKPLKNTMEETNF